MTARRSSRPARVQRATSDATTTRSRMKKAAPTRNISPSQLRLLPVSTSRKKLPAATIAIVTAQQTRMRGRIAR
jgi:hypothetical protein